MAVDLQLASTAQADVPTLEDIDHWVSTTLSTIGRPASNVTVRVVDEDEIIALNHHYRGRHGPTNVLAFPFETVAEVDYASLGDIVICFSVVKNESNQQDITLYYHFAHMVIHGTLHLCGFNHHDDDEAEVMEAAEKKILARVGLS
jgi:probable rRNA maturation factor